MCQILLPDINIDIPVKKQYRGYLTAAENFKGVLDVDTVKGCTAGMAAYPDGGCYGECYANKIASRYGIDFTTSVVRKLYRSNRTDIFIAVKNHKAGWYRVGTAGDPCHNWNNTIEILEFLKYTGKVPVIITKHWTPLTDVQITKLRNLSAVINTSTSALDTPDELNHRIEQIGRLKYAGIKSVNRVVTCDFTLTTWAKERKTIQDYLLSFKHVIDNPLRATQSNKYVKRGDIKLTKCIDAIGGGKYVSLHYKSVYLGACGGCTEQCGADHTRPNQKGKTEWNQNKLNFL